MYEWGMPHMKQSYPTWIRSVTCEFVESHMNVSCHVWTNHVAQISQANVTHYTRYVRYEWGMPHRVISNINESRHVWISRVAYECVVLHKYCRQTWLTPMARTLFWVISHMNEVCHIWKSHLQYEFVVSHMNWSHVSCCTDFAGERDSPTSPQHSAASYHI